MTEQTTSAPRTNDDRSEDEPVTAYKAFGMDWKCLDMQYAVGQTFTHAGPVVACESGLHACERPLDVLRYYKPGTSRFAVVRAAGKISRHGDDSKIAAASLTIEAEISLPEIIAKTIAWTLARCEKSKGATTDKEKTAVATSGYSGAATATGYFGAATASGDSGAATATGYSGAATATGNSGAATATGDSGAATATGYFGAATASGYFGAATATGNSGAATATGYSGAATASGNSGAATATGYFGAATASGYFGAATASGNSGAATATGDYGAATATGYSGAATATGDYGAATATGYFGAATATGKKTTASAHGRNGRARAPAGGAIFLVYRDSRWNIVHARASKVGENGVAANTWYRLDADGNFEACEA